MYSQYRVDHVAERVDLERKTPSRAAVDTESMGEDVALEMDIGARRHLALDEVGGFGLVPEVHTCLGNSSANHGAFPLRMTQGYVRTISAFPMLSIKKVTASTGYLLKYKARFVVNGPGCG